MSKAKRIHERPESVLKNMERIYPFHTTLNSKIGILESNGKKYILKERYEEGLQREYHWLKLLQKKGFGHSPSALGIVRYAGKKAILQEFIEGRTIEQDKSLFYKHADRIASLLARLYLLTRRSKRPAHNLMADQLGAAQHTCRMVQSAPGLAKRPDLLPFFLKGKKSLAKMAKVIEAKKSDLEYAVTPSLVNNEMEFVVAKDRKIYLIDWENGSYGDAAYDIADLRYIYPDMDLPRFIRVFQKAAGISEDMAPRVELYLPLLILREIFYDILNYMTSAVYLNMPPKIVAVLSQIRMKDKSDTLDLLCHKF